MVSIISKWLQKRIPSYEKIESNLTKEQVENNKDIINSLKINIFLFISLLILTYIVFKLKIFNRHILFILILSIFINACSIISSILIARCFYILRYKLYMFMVGISLISDFISLFFMIIDEADNFFTKISLFMIAIIFIILLFFKKIINKNKYKSILNFMIGITSIISILSVIFDFKNGIGNLIKSFIGIFFMLVLLKVVFDTLKIHYRTLFYLLAYPEEFRKKFGYSIKEWYGLHSSQYKAEKE